MTPSSRAARLALKALPAVLFGAGAIYLLAEAPSAAAASDTATGRIAFAFVGVLISFSLTAGYIATRLLPRKSNRERWSDTRRGTAKIELAGFGTIAIAAVVLWLSLEPDTPYATFYRQFAAVLAIATFHSIWLQYHAAKNQKRHAPGSATPPQL